MDYFLSSVGQPVEDSEEESFLLFTRPIPSAKNLGFIDSRAPSVEIPLHGKEYTIQQSPSLLSSRRAGGTTGAVLWKITPLFAEWISSVATNALWTHPTTPLSLSQSRTTAVELGCGIAGLLALAMGPHVGYYVATDQEYVRRLLRENLEANKALAYKPLVSGQKKGRSGTGTGTGQRHKRSAKDVADEGSNILFAPLDWELDAPETLKQSVGIPLSSSPRTTSTPDYEDKGFDLLFSCDCVYNEALVAPFVRTCADICRLRPAYRPGGHASETSGLNPTVCIIAQQQRTPDVFEAWLEETLKVFWVWRLEDSVLVEGLKAGSGYVVYLLLLREDLLG